MYREPDSTALTLQAERQAQELSMARREREKLEQLLYATRRKLRVTRAAHVGGYLGSGAALLGCAIDIYTGQPWFALIGLTCGWFLGAVLSLQGETEPVHVDHSAGSFPPE